MNSVKVDKFALLSIVENNRSKHRQIFLEAQQGFRKKAIEELEKMLRAAREGQRVVASYTLPAPMDQTKEYDTVISMLKMSVENTVELDHRSYCQYVLDNWHWRAQFYASNAPYSGTAAAVEAADDQ